MKPRLTQWLIGLCLLVLMTGLGYGVEQSDFYPLIGLYAVFFGLYVWVCRQKLTISQVHFFIACGIVLRFMLLFSMPNLSDDIYRFIWDGRLINQGINPFEQLPSYYIHAYQGVPLQGITSDLFAQLNSPEYFTIYPPIAQGVFALATWLFPTSISGSAFVMKLFLFGCEVGSIFLLYKLFRQQLQTILWYVLNPLIILEIVGNLHFEGAMIFFLLGAIFPFYLLNVMSLQRRKGAELDAFVSKKQDLWGYTKKGFVFSAILFAASIASKLLTLLFLPFLIRMMGWKRSFQYYSIVGLVLLLLFFPLLSGVFFSNFGESLDLYFRRFEFNGSLYYITRWLGFQMNGYNMIAKIGPALALFATSGILILAFGKKRQLLHFPPLSLWAICLYLLCTTTVHPWYTALPVVLCLFTPFRFPILWSGLIFLTYINYSYTEYFANMWVVALEYSLVLGFLLYEILREK